MGQNDKRQLIGTWETAPWDHPSLDRLGRVSLHFTPCGALVHTTWAGQQESVVFLRYRVEGARLVTFDRAQTGEDSCEFSLTRSGELQLSDSQGATTFLRGSSSSSVDSSSDLLDLAIFGLTFGFQRLRETEELHPCLLTESAGLRTFRVFDQSAQDRSASVTHARSAVEIARDGIDASVIIFDGLLTFAGKRHDAVFAEACERDCDHGITLAQRYLTKKPAMLRKSGTVVYCGRTVNPLWAAKSRPDQLLHPRQEPGER